MIFIIVSSRSLMHSSVSFSLLYIALRVLFISEIELSIFDSVIFIVKNILLQLSEFILVIFLIQLTFSLPIFPIIYLINCLFLFHYLFFLGFSLAFFN